MTLLLLHLDIAPAVASAEAARTRGVGMPAVSVAERLSGMLLTLTSAVAQFQHIDTPPLAPAPGLPPAWGASAGVYGGVVNLGNGNLCLQVPLVGWANGVSFVLVFNSQANPSQSSPIAPKWTHNWHVFLQVSSDGRQATLQEGDGSRWVYRDNDLDGVFTAPTGVFDRLLRQADGRYVLERKGSEERWEFAASGSVRVLERVADRYGRAIVLGYANGRLQTVTDRYNRALTLVYQDSRLWKVVDFMGRAWELQYDGNGRLWKVVFPVVDDENGQARTYQLVLGYNARGNVISWTDRLGNTWQYGYVSSTSDALKWFQDPMGHRWTVLYSRAVAAIGIGSGSVSETGSARWVDPTQVWVEYGFAEALAVRIAQGGNATSERLTTRLWYNGQYQVVKRQDTAGLVWEWSYDPQGNLLWSKEPNGAMTTYIYYQGTDRVWKVTDALGHVWEYTYTSGYGDVKSVKDPEGGVVQYVYDYELNEPVYGLVRQVIDAMGRATEYQYYAADEANLARRGQVRRVIVPGGFWREMDYSGLGWLVSRTVQTANGSETTTYTHDAWGRLREIDYPRSADVRMGWDGENRRVWVQDGAGRRDYTYDAWGRVVLQEGCCGSSEGIEVVAVSAEYDTAGRKRFERERRSDGSVVRTVEYTYDALGRLQSVGDDRGAVGYSYELGTGRLQREDYPNGSFVAYTYYGTSHPLQVGQVWKVEHKRANSDSLLIGYEYTYDLLGRVVQSVERPSGDTTVYTYTPAGRLASEVRTGQVAYRREYEYNSDGSRRYVERADAVNGFHQDEYVYDAVSGRLVSVIDRAPEPDVVYSFSWNPEGTLARWSNNQPNSYARVFGYDEEGRLTRIERDYGDRVEAVYEYGYNSDGVQVWKRDGLAQQEYRYVCRIGCGGVPMRVYSRAIGSEGWDTLEEYMAGLSSVWYGTGAESAQDYGWLAGHWLSGLTPPPAGVMLYQDWFGVRVGGEFEPTAVHKRVPDYLVGNPDLPDGRFALLGFQIPAICAIPCGVAGLCMAAGLAYLAGCMVGCRGSSDYWGCVATCLGNIPGWILALCGVAILACILCVLWPFLPRINDALQKLCPGYPGIIAKCMREAGKDLVKLVGCIAEECMKARKPPIIIPGRPSMGVAL